MGASVVTTEDLMEFKNQLLVEFKALMVEHTHPQPKTWMRSAEVKRHLAISQGTLQNLRDKRVIPCYRVDGLFFYDALEVDRVLIENKVDI